MKPADWQPYQRGGDGELIGYLQGSGEAVTPISLVGYPLGDPTDAATAVRTLEADGLAILAEVWSLELEDEVIEVRIVAARPDAIVVIEAPYGYQLPGGRRLELSVPVAGLTPGRRH